MGATGYNAVLNSCKPISSSDPVICQPGVMACQKAAAGGAAFKAMAKAITTSALVGASRSRRARARAAAARSPAN